MSLTVFLSTALALLLAPGPTNTLMAVAGAQADVGKVVRLLPAELAGYLTAIIPLVYLGSEILERWPFIAPGLKIAAAIWLIFLAIRLWRRSDDDGDMGQVSSIRIYLTTMLNPKALVFGLVLLPAPNDAHFLPYLGMFCIMVSGVALIWGAAGQLTQMRGSGQRLQFVRRSASLWLAFVSISLLASI